MQKYPAQLSGNNPESNIQTDTGKLALRKNVSDKPTATAKSWPHLVAGASAGVTTAVLTSPLDVLRTRLQSDYYRSQLAPQPLFRNTSTTGSFSFFRTSLNHFRETIYILSSIPRVEGWRGLFRGLGPGLTGVVPASGIKFYTYGNGKRIISETFSLPDDAAIVHIGAAAFSGIATGSATNPIWLVKTRLQLDNSRLEEGSIRQRRYKSSLDCIGQIFRQEGIRGFYRGLSASYLGVAESTLHLTLYEQLKIFIRRQRTVYNNTPDTQWNHALDWAETGGAAALSKIVAGTLGYPHEVLRTRLRQAPMENGVKKYTGLIQCFQLMWKQEGLVAMYGGLTAHLLRAVPSAAIMLGVYEYVLKEIAPKT